MVVGLFAALRRRGREPSTPAKIAWGLVTTAASTLLMVIAVTLTHGGQVRASMAWLIGTYGIITLGELCLSPMGLSLVTKLTPPRLVGLTMGGWFLATAFGNNLSGFLGGVQGMMEPASFFLVLSGAAALVALFLYVQLPKLDKVIKQYGGG